MSSITRLSKNLYRSLLRWTKRKEVANTIFELRGKDLGYSINSQLESYYNPHQKYETAEGIRDLIRTIYRNKNNYRLSLSNSTIQKEKIAKESLDFAFESFRHLNTFTTNELALIYAQHQTSFDPATLQYIKYQIGEVVTHSKSNRRGVVIGWKIEPAKDTTPITPPKQVLHLIFDERDHLIYEQNQPKDGVGSIFKSLFTSKPIIHVFADEVELLYSTPLTTTNPPYHNERFTYIHNHLLQQIFISFNQQLQRYIPYPQLAYFYPKDFRSSLYSSFYERKYLEKLFHLYSNQEEKEAIIAIGQEGKKNLILLEEVILQEKILTFIDEETGNIIHQLTNHFPGLMGMFFTSQTVNKGRTSQYHGLLDDDDKQLNQEYIINDILGNILRNIGKLNTITVKNLQNELKKYHPNYSPSLSSSFSFSSDNHMNNSNNKEDRYLNYLQLKVKINDVFNHFLDIYFNIDQLLSIRFQSLQSTSFLNLPTIQTRTTTKATKKNNTNNNSNNLHITPLTEKTRHLIALQSYPRHKYVIGQVVKHKQGSMIGVISNIDQRPLRRLNNQNTSLIETPRTTSPEQPYYHIHLLAPDSNNNTTTATLMRRKIGSYSYYAEEDLELFTDHKTIKQLIITNQQLLNNEFIGFDEEIKQYRLNHYQKYLYPFDYHSFPSDYPRTTVLQAYQSQRKKNEQDVVMKLEKKKNNKEEDLEALKQGIREEEIRVYAMIDDVLLFLHHHYHTIFDSLYTQSLYSPFHSSATVTPPKNAVEIRQMIEESLSSIRQEDEEQEKEVGRRGGEDDNNNDDNDNEEGEVIKQKKKGKKKKTTTKKNKNMKITSTSLPSPTSIHYNDLLQFINISNLSIDAHRTSSKLQSILSLFHPNREIHILLRIASHQRKSYQYYNAREILMYIIEELDSSCISAYHELSKIDYDENKLYHTIHTSFKILQYCPLHPQALIIIGKCYDQLDQFDKAEAFYRLQLDYHPWSSEVTSLLYQNIHEKKKRDQLAKEEKSNIINNHHHIQKNEDNQKNNTNQPSDNE